MTPHPRWLALAILIAVPVVAAAQQQQGDARGPDQLSRARALVGKSRYAAALAIFDSLARTQPASRDAALGRAQMLAWLGRMTDAVRAYERWVASHPKDVEALELLAQALLWAGRTDDAERVYKLLAAAGSDEAERGLARLAARRGDLPGSERRWRAIVARRPGDSEAWAGLAQVLRWTHRTREARTALKRALEANPANREAAEQLRWVEAALAPRVEPTVASLEDTDGNQLLAMGATAAYTAPWEGELSARGHRRTAEFGPSRASTIGAELSATGVTARFAFRGSLGAARFDAGAFGSKRDVLTAAARASAAVRPGTDVSVRIGRQPFDETAAIIRLGIVTTTFGAGGSMDLSRRTTLSGEFEHARLDGATPNSRSGGAAWARWRAPRVLSLFGTVRAFGYASDPGEGYFAPRRYLLAEAGAQLAIGRQLGWSVTLDGGLGAQSLDLRSAGSETQPAARGALGIVYRPTPRLEWGLTGHTANAASAATSSLTSYRASGWTAKGRVGF